MADTKISALTTDSSPDRAADFVPIYDASGGDTNKVALQDVGAYPLFGYFGTNGVTNPADATTFYFSGNPYVGGVTTAANHKIRIPRGGVVRKVYIEGTCTTGTSETSTISFRLNDTTDTTITTAAAFNATPFSFSNTALTITVATGDYCNLKWVSPTWVTNPTAVIMWAVIWVA